MNNIARVGIYIHIPYCLSKCPYCDFNSYAIHRSVETSDGLGELEDDYTEAVVSEISTYARSDSWRGREVATIFFGGGTPSLFSHRAIARILESISTDFPIAANAEVTLECNPGTIHERLDVDRLARYRAAGVNRISLGAQSFSAAKLKKLGRLHAPDDTKSAVRNICEAGYTNFNLDLIFSVEGETLADWKKDINEAIALEPNHISPYNLTIEPGTEFHARTRKGAVLTVSEEAQAELFAFTETELGTNGYQRYEISNFAKPTFECAHNLAYWRRTPYLGIGAGAHGFDDTDWGTRWSNERSPKIYIERVTQEGHSRVKVETLSERDAEFEFLFLGLRTIAGISRKTFVQSFTPARWEPYAAFFQQAAGDGLILQNNGSVRLSKRGVLFSDSIFEALARVSVSKAPQQPSAQLVS